MPLPLLPALTSLAAYVAPIVIDKAVTFGTGLAADYLGIGDTNPEAQTQKTNDAPNTGNILNNLDIKAASGNIINLLNNSKPDIKIETKPDEIDTEQNWGMMNYLSKITNVLPDKYKEYAKYGIAGAGVTAGLFGLRKALSNPHIPNSKHVALNSTLIKRPLQDANNVRLHKNSLRTLNKIKNNRIRLSAKGRRRRR